MATNAPASEGTTRVDQATEQEPRDDLSEPESLASADVILVRERTTSGRRALPPPNPGATYRGAHKPLPRPPRRPRLTTVDSEGHALASEGDGLEGSASSATATASLPPPEGPAAPADDSFNWSDTGMSLLPVVTSTTPADDPTAEEPSAPSHSRRWPPHRRLVAAAAIAASAVAAVAYVAARGVERPAQHVVDSEASPAKQEAAATLEAMGVAQPPADRPAESRDQRSPAEPLPTDDENAARGEGNREVESTGATEDARKGPAAEPDGEHGDPDAVTSSPDDEPSNEARPAAAAEPSAQDDNRPADADKPFDRAAARSALNAAALAASGCNQDGLVAPPPAVVAVTFVPIGRATSVVVEGGPYAGTATGSCIAGAFRGLSVPAYSGQDMTARITVTLR